MAGYIDRSMSVNAHIARQDGLLTYSELKAWQKRAVDAFAIRPCEWHHTSKTYNRTDFYDPEDFANLNPADYPPIRKKDTADEPEEAVYEWKEWGVINRFGKKGFVQHEPVKGTVIGEWFHYEGGKKNVNGKHMRRVV